MRPFLPKIITSAANPTWSEGSNTRFPPFYCKPEGGTLELFPPGALIEDLSEAAVSMLCRRCDLLSPCSWIKVEQNLWKVIADTNFLWTKTLTLYVLDPSLTTSQLHTHTHTLAILSLRTLAMSVCSRRQTPAPPVRRCSIDLFVQRLPPSPPSPPSLTSSMLFSLSVWVCPQVPPCLM